MPQEHTFDLEVRYYETDGQGVVHHSNYFRYFELARVELLKQVGHDYADLERDGYMLVVSKIDCRYRSPARYGDLLRIHIRTTRARGARIDHEYRIACGERLIAEGHSTIACIGRDGLVQRIPEILELDEK
ncbi:Acyl-CoA thioester hydrolase YbgC [Pseudobythopirellula maris]|uniref:Acyl-CoA thioester hydrolase YbgC n=1 Tax=Pseudobythopirellula maris TaxID=2527991 RepID=A0A5C5ZSU2_9BACT|nr:thioesterase family protein [Pseudobythopirellula maris]TWT90604.1 Acyl-CoA thioester hydrolase YbgC [Pseudobythopirellula maris]